MLVTKVVLSINELHVPLVLKILITAQYTVHLCIILVQIDRRVLIFLARTLNLTSVLKLACSSTKEVKNVVKNCLVAFHIFDNFSKSLKV